jgi:hypothetical protein
MYNNKMNLPTATNEYILRVEAPESNLMLQKYLDDTGWEYIEDGGEIHGDPYHIDRTFVTKIYGLKYSTVNQHI